MKVIFILLLSVVTSHSLMACGCNYGKAAYEYKKQNFIVYGKILKVEKSILKKTLTTQVLKRYKQEQGLSSLEKDFDLNRSILKVKVLILKKYKGKTRLKKTTIYTQNALGACGISVREGEEIIIYANLGKYEYSHYKKLKATLKKQEKPYLKKNSYWTSICTRTTYKTKDEIALLDKLVEAKKQ
ncbi:MAG: hypothetical protein GY810_23100 [Aureispira sp.]|nr:hypothetical protein [Aureispira sp.]